MRLVVIGGVAAGLSAATRARRLDRSLEVLVLERGTRISHAACGLPYLLTGEVRSLDQLQKYSAEYFERERGIRIRTGAEVVGIEHGRRQLRLAGGETIRYDKLVIATGARPEPEVEGRNLEHVFTLHTPEDALALSEFLRRRRPRTAAVVGAGYLGLEAAEALRANGVRVTLYEANPYVLGRDDADLATRVRRHMERFFVDLRLGHRVRSIGELNAEIVILAAGMKPNVALAVGTGAQTGSTGAVKVSERMETTVSGIWAAGDCVESTHLVSGRSVWIPLGATANKTGRVAGANAAGRRERFPGVAGTCIVSVCGLGIGLTGLSEAEARHAGFDPVSARIDARDRAGYLRSRPTMVELVADRGSGRILGGVVTGEREVAGRIGVIATALTARMTLDDFEQLDLPYAPPFAPVWDPLLIAAQTLRKHVRLR